MMLSTDNLTTKIANLLYLRNGKIANSFLILWEEIKNDAIFEEMGKSDRFSLIGHSLGAMIAINFALTYANKKDDAKLIF
ncbi:MAG: alpha/beta hydrolase [Waterburya sp.]